MPRNGVRTPNETARKTAQQQVRRAGEKARKKAKQAILAGIEASVTSHGWPSPAAPAGLAAPPPSVLNPTVADGLAVAPAAALAAAPEGAEVKVVPRFPTAVLLLGSDKGSPLFATPHQYRLTLTAPELCTVLDDYAAQCRIVEKDEQSFKGTHLEAIRQIKKASRPAPCNATNLSTHWDLHTACAWCFRIIHIHSDYMCPPVRRLPLVHVHAKCCS